MILNISKTLSKDDVVLHLLDEKTIEPLTKLAADSRIWQNIPGNFQEPSVFKEKWINKAINQIANNKRICFAVFLSGEIAGSSSYYQIDLENKKLNIGYTWFSPKFWGSTVNPLTKFIMLEYAFDHIKCIRVEFSVDSCNVPSHKALNKLGIKKEGTLRNHLILSDGRIRDSVVYSVTYQEWPEVKANIQQILNNHE